MGETVALLDREVYGMGRVDRLLASPVVQRAVGSMDTNGGVGTTNRW